MFYNKIKDYRIMRQMSQTQLAQKIGVAKSTISMYESGKREPAFEILEAIADILNVSFYDLIGRNEHDYLYGSANQNQKPLLGVIHCGEPVLCEENIESYVTIPEGISCDFVLRCEGDSMINANIFDGDVVYIRIQPEVENGEIAAVRVDDETTLKRFYKNGDTVTLMPENPKYQPQFYSAAQLAEIQIIGKAVGLTRIFK